jgi:hypothetical protein
VGTTLFCFGGVVGRLVISKFDVFGNRPENGNFFFLGKKKGEYPL